VIRLYIGTYTRESAAEGIYTCEWDPEAGRFSRLALAAGADNPSFLIVRGKVLLAVNESSDHEGGGAVSSFRMTGARLTLTARWPSHGADPCHVAVCGVEAAVANYGGGTVATFQLEDGVLTRAQRVVRFNAHGPDPRQSRPHPHGVYYHRGELLVSDLGGDCVYRLRSSTGHSLAPLPVPAGSGPRHLAIAATGRLYVVNELANTVNVVDQGCVVQTVSTLPSGTELASSTAEILLDASERRLFVSNRGHDSLASWAVDPNTGLLGTADFHSAGGRHPRHFAMSPGGRWLLVANRDSNRLVAITLAPDGRPAGIGDALECPAPVCIALSS
jgi:6-phosphogluconolactonase